MVLDLSVSDEVKSALEVLFKALIDKLLLQVDLLKVGRILGTRWFASSFRAVSALWITSEASVIHFKETKKDPR
uniref:Uncharacterized protein n=2 Tax=Timema TaxID=61471 RepID=A0A7R9FZG6_TIMSH|nr:unnamed protein product [Timema shepardi]CAD7572044.1 unnamed protein product [Timema californicum]